MSRKRAVHFNEYLYIKTNIVSNDKKKEQYISVNVYEKINLL